MYSNMSFVSSQKCLRIMTPSLYTVLVFAFTWLVQFASAGFGSASDPASDKILQSDEAVLVDQMSTNSSQLECLEVGSPVVTPPPASSPCAQLLMDYSFANSYGKPFVGQYSPPACNFNRVVLNLTVQGAGRQFDRLAIAYLGDTEIWRTSTAEPTAAPGIIWTYMKDVSPYLSLWKQPQPIIFDLGNIVNDVYTSPFNATLTATFLNSNQANELPPADVIIPLSGRRSAAGASSDFKLPQTQAINNFTIPRNAKRAVFSISACGQMAEEFWWSNVPDSTTSTFGNTTELLGHSPFREVQLLIDGQLAGVSWPFPVIFTGGVVPGFWRPVVGIDAFDLREDEIDVTPWLPMLSDGQSHSYEIRVMGLSDDGSGNVVFSTVGDYWVVTGKLFLWLDTAESTTSGSNPVISGSEPQFFITSSTGDSGNTTLNYQVLAQRQLTVSTSVTTTAGTEEVSWTQALSYSNIANFVANGSNQTNTMVISGTESSSGGYSRKFAYPLVVFNAITQSPDAGGMSIDGRLDRSKNIQTLGATVFPSPLDAFIDQGKFDGWTITNRQNGTAFYFTDGNSSSSAGVTEQDFVLRGISNSRSRAEQTPMGTDGAQLYSRHILAANNSVVSDIELGPSALPNGVAPFHFDITQLEMSDFAMIPMSSVAGGKVIQRTGTA